MDTILKMSREYMATNLINVREKKISESIWPFYIYKYDIQILIILIRNTLYKLKYENITIRLIFFSPYYKYIFQELGKLGKSLFSSQLMSIMHRMCKTQLSLKMYSE